MQNILKKFQEALNQDGNPAMVFELADLAANILDQTLLTGDTGEAFRLAGAQRPDRPASIDSPTLPGALTLKFTPGESRRLYQDSVHTLFIAIHHGRRQYLPWLIEALQIAYPGERFAVEAAIRTLALPEEVARNSFSHWPAKIKSPAHLEAALQGLANLESQHWMLNFLEAASNDAAFLKRTEEMKVCVFSEYCKNGGEHSQRLARLIATASPVLCYGAVAVIKRENLLDAKVQDALVSCFKKPQTSLMAKRFLLEAFKKLCLFGVTVDLERQYFESLKVQIDPREISSAAAFEFNHYSPKALTVEFSEANLRLNANRIHAAEWDGKLHCLYKRLIKVTASDAWLTDEDEFGLLTVDLKTGHQKIAVLPVSFAIQATGAAGAKRTIESIARSSAHIYFSITNPFQREGRWGDESFLFSYSLSSGKWAHWLNSQGQLIETEIGAVVDCSTLQPTTWGTLRFSGKAGKIFIENDCTAYAFESAESDVRSFPAIDDDYLPWNEPTSVQCEATQKSY